MPEWIAALLTHYFCSRQIDVNDNELQDGYLKVSLAYDADLEINYISEDEGLLFSLRLNLYSDDALLKQLLRLNHYTQRLPQSPIGHLFEHNIVLRLYLEKHQLDLTGLDTAYSKLLQKKQAVTEV